MTITKLGHCCLVITINGKRVMTDPGSYTIAEQELESNIDLIVITHEHQDHLHVESLKKILIKNPEAIVVSNSAVGKILADAGIPHNILEVEGGIGEFAGVLLEAHGSTHAEIYEEFGQVQNTGYFIGEYLFYPGDAFTNPNKQVDILALPIAGPWMKLKEAVVYAKELKPRIAFPVHDAIISNFALVVGKMVEQFLVPTGIEFKVLELGKAEEF